MSSFPGPWDTPTAEGLGAKVQRIEAENEHLREMTARLRSALAVIAAGTVRSTTVHPTVKQFARDTLASERNGERDA